MATANLLQTSVSGGTQNALSLQGDGVFFPKASTTSRLALTLTTTDKGFIVYDTTDNNIYFWNGAAWESVPSSGDAGANGSVQYNDNGIVSGATNFVWDKATGNVGVGAAPTEKLSVNGSIGFQNGGTQRWHITANASSNLIFTRSSVADRLTITADGNVGVGVTPGAWRTSVPFNALQVGYTGAVYGITTSEQVNLSSNYLQDTGGNEVRIQAGFATRYQQSSGQHLWSTAASSTAGSGITFTQAMTLTDAGYLLVGTTSTSVTNGGVVTYGISAGQLAIGHATGTAGATAYAGFQYAGTEIGSITQNGTTGVLYNIVSDYRLKESVAPLSGGLARVNALKPSVYNWKSDGSTGEGFLAHELAEVVPFAVSGEKDAVDKDGKIKSQGIDMSRVVPILVAAIQELTARVKTLESR